MSIICLLSIITLIAKGKQKHDFLSLRYPTMEGLVIMPPGNFDSNTCSNSTNGRYDGGGFYLQDTVGNGIFVCPNTPELVIGVNYGDRVKITGQTTTDQHNILTIIANSINVLKTNQQCSEKIAVVNSFDEFNLDANFGDLIQIKGFVTEIAADFGFGEIFTIQDCYDETIKGWWTRSIDESTTAKEIFGVTDDANFVPKYFRMVGFVENFFPICFPFDDGKEFQPRFVREMVEIAAPCIPPK